MSEKNRTLLVMTLSMTLGYMPWYNFSAVLKYLADEFHLSASDTGWILASFQAGYVIVVGVTGWLGDRISLKKIAFWATLITGIFSTLFVLGGQGERKHYFSPLNHRPFRRSHLCSRNGALVAMVSAKGKRRGPGSLYRGPCRLLCRRIFDRRAFGRFLWLADRNFMDLHTGDSSCPSDRSPGSGCTGGRGNQSR